MNATKPQEQSVDDTVADSFPASDPPSHTPVEGTRKAEQIQQAEADAEDAIPKGRPTNDRHAAETTAGRVDGSGAAEKHDP